VFRNCEDIAAKNAKLQKLQKLQKTPKRFVNFFFNVVRCSPFSQTDQADVDGFHRSRVSAKLPDVSIE
jgi:hypothetical protein